MYERRNKPYPNKPMFSATHKTWRAVEKRVRNGVVVEVNELPLPVPKYSFVVSTAKTDEGGQIITTNRHVPLHLVDDALDLLRDMQDKYAAIRESKQQEFDARKAHMSDNDEHDEFSEPVVTRKMR